MKNLFFTKTTNYLILGLTFFTLLLGACSNDDMKDDDEDNLDGYKISFKVDGVLKVFEDLNMPPYAYIDEGLAQFGDVGYDGTIYFAVYDSIPIGVKDYKGYVVKKSTNGNKVVGASITYSHEKLSYTTDLANPTVRVLITKLTSTDVRGEFSGTLKSQDKKTEIKITEGKFRAERRVLLQY